MTVDGYLARLGLDRPSAPTYHALVELHRRHLERVPYDNLEIMLGRPPSTEPAACLARIVETGRAGYCFHQNGAFELVLRELGYDVSRRHGYVWSEVEPAGPSELTHLVLVVAGLPTRDNPGGQWWADVGLGAGFLDPVPLVAGRHRQDGFAYVIGLIDESGWAFRPEPRHSFGGVHVQALPVGDTDVAAAHRALSTPPDGGFTRVPVCSRRIPGGVETVRGCMAVRASAAGKEERVLATYDEWRDVITGIGVSLDGIGDDELRALHERTWAAHLEWQAMLHA